MRRNDNRMGKVVVVCYRREMVHEVMVVGESPRKVLLPIVWSVKLWIIVYWEDGAALRALRS